jgi:hypothetical protein
MSEQEEEESMLVGNAALFSLAGRGLKIASCVVENMQHVIFRNIFINFAWFIFSLLIRSREKKYSQICSVLLTLNFIHYRVYVMKATLSLFGYTVSSVILVPLSCSTKK